MISTFKKDPDAVLDFLFDWSQWLLFNEIISSYTIIPDSGLTVDSTSQSNSVVTVWISGGTAGKTYELECKILTSISRIDKRTMTIEVVSR